MMTSMITPTPDMRRVTAMDSAALYRLMSWMSPSYPVGAFSYSHSLEWEVEEKSVQDVASLARWLTDVLLLGAGRNDAMLFVEAYKAAGSGDGNALIEAADYANAFSSTAERHMETMSQGRAFCDITCRTWTSATLARFRELYGSPIAYPVAVGIAASDHGVPLEAALEAYLHAFASNLVSAGVRLVPLGHTDGQRVMIQLEPVVRDAVCQGLAGSLSTLSSSLVMADISAMKHETQYTRLFRS